MKATSLQLVCAERMRLRCVWFSVLCVSFSAWRCWLSCSFMCNYCMQELQRFACNNCTWSHGITGHQRHLARRNLLLWSVDVLCWWTASQHAVTLDKKILSNVNCACASVWCQMATRISKLILFINYVCQLATSAVCRLYILGLELWLALSLV